MYIPFRLSEEEDRDLIVFMGTLTSGERSQIIRNALRAYMRAVWRGKRDISEHPLPTQGTLDIKQLLSAIDDNRE